MARALGGGPGAAAAGPARSRADRRAARDAREPEWGGRRRDGAGTAAARAGHQRAHGVRSPRAVAGDVAGVGPAAGDRPHGPTCDSGGHEGAVPPDLPMDGRGETRAVPLVRKTLTGPPCSGGRGRLSSVGRLERWPSGRRRRFAKPLYGPKAVSRVRIPHSPQIRPPATHRCARTERISAALSSINSPDTSTTIFSRVPVNVNGAW